MSYVIPIVRYVMILLTRPAGLALQERLNHLIGMHASTFAPQAP